MSQDYGQGICRESGAGDYGVDLGDRCPVSEESSAMLLDGRGKYTAKRVNILVQPGTGVEGKNKS